MVNYLLAQGIVPTDEDYLNIMDYCLYSIDDAEIVKSLIPVSLQANGVLFEDDDEVVSHAVTGDRVEVMNVFLDAGVDVNINLFGTATLIHYAVNRSLEMTKLLIGYGADITTVDSEGRTPLMIAQESGNDEIVRLLLDAGADEKLV